MEKIKEGAEYKNVSEYRLPERKTGILYYKIMKFKTLSYSESKETADAIGLKQWVKIGVEMEVQENESEELVMSCARERVKQWHKESNPGAYFTVNPEALPVIQSKDR